MNLKFNTRLKKLLSSSVSTLSSIAIATSPLMSGTLAAAETLPTGGQVEMGSATISTPTDSSMVVNQSSDKAVIGWDSFSIGSGGQVNFQVPDASSATLNRVNGSMTSTIAGQMRSNGQLFLINPNGILITPTGSVRTNAFIGSSLDISNSDFLAGKNHFKGNGSSADVINQGSIITEDGGVAVLLGGHVENSGSIEANEGAVGLGAGEDITVDLTGDGLLSVTVPTSNTNQTRALISQSGRIKANGGHVELKAATTAMVPSAAINVTGAIEADSVAQTSDGVSFGGGAAPAAKPKPRIRKAQPTGKAGTILVDGGAGGTTVVASKLSAASKSGKGGQIIVTGKKVQLTAATLDASGSAGGGKIEVGGSWQGNGPVSNAKTTEIDEHTVINASATDNGNGGEVVIWADDDTTFKGLITARGGDNGGDGGNVEVSGKAHLNYLGFVSTLAANGKTGNLLLDPYNVTISTGTNTNQTGFTATGTGSIINITTLQTALASSNVTVSTGSSGAEAGNITLANALTWSANTTLTLSAAGSIVLNANITKSGATSGLVLNAGTDGISGTGAIANTGTLEFNVANAAASGTLSGAITGTGSVTKSGAGTLTLSGTNTFSGDTNVNGGTLRAGSTAAFGTNSAVTVGAAGTLDINGNNVSIGSLAGSAGGIVTNSGVSAATLTTGGKNTSTIFSGTMQDGNSALAITKVGSGSLSINSAQTFTGALTIAQGAASAANTSVDLLAGASLATDAVNIGTGGAAGQAVLRNRADNQLTNAVVTLNGILTKYGYWILEGTNQSVKGIVDTSANGVIEATESLTSMVSTLTLTGSGTYSYNGALRSFASVATGNVLHLTKNGAGVQTLSGNGVIHTGTTTINSGTLDLSFAAAKTLSGSFAGSGNLIKSGAGVLTLSGVNTFSGATTISAGSIAFSSNSDQTLSGNFSGTGGLTKSGTGTLTLSGNNTYSGATTISGGTLKAGSTTAFSSTSAHNVGAAGTLDLGGFSVSIGSLTGAAGGIVTNNGAAATLTTGGNNTATTFSGTLQDGTGALAVTKVGTGAFSLNSAHTFTGALTIAHGGNVANIDLLAGASLATGNVNIGTGAGGAAANYAQLRTRANNQLTNAVVTFNGGSGKLATWLMEGTNQSVKGIVDSSGFGYIVASNVGSSMLSTLTLTGADTYTFNGSARTTFGSGTGNVLSLVKSGTGTQTISGTGTTFTGNTTINGGTLQLMDTTNFVSAITVNAGATLSLARTANGFANRGTLTRLIDGSGTVSIDSTTSGINGGWVRFNTSNSGLASTFTGNVVVNSGVLTMDNVTGAWSSSANLTVNSGGLFGLRGQDLTVESLSGSGDIFNSYTGSGAAGNTLTVNNSSANTFSGSIYGTIASGGTDGALEQGRTNIAKSGAGSLTLSGNNTYNGTTTVNGGTLIAGSATAFGTDSAVTVGAAGTIDLNGNSLSIGSLAGIAGGIVTNNGAASTLTTGSLNTDTDFAGSLQNGTGTLALVKTGTGKLTLSSGNSYSGGTSINAGVLNVGHANALGSTGDIVFGGGTLQYSSANNSDYSGRFVKTGGQAWNIDTNDRDVLFATALEGAGSTLTKSGTGTLTLSAANTYTGATTVNVGTLTLSGGLDVGAGTATTNVAAGAILNGTGIVTAGTLSHSGLGNLSLTGSNKVDNLATTGTVGSLTFRNGRSLSVGSITASSISVQTTGATSDLTLGAGTVLTASDTGTAVILAAERNFINNAGSGAIALTGTGTPNWQIYSVSPAGNTFGGLDSGNTAVWGTSFGQSVSAAGNRYVFANNRTVTITSTDLSKTYGDAVDLTNAYTVSGLEGVAGAFSADTASAAFSGTVGLTSSGSAVTANVVDGGYGINVDLSGLTAQNGFTLAAASTGKLSVDKRAITITADAKSMTYGDAAPTLTHVVGGLGLVNGDTLTGALATTASNTSDVGTYGITQGTLAASANYAVTYTGNNVTVGTRAITITADAKSMTYGDAAPTLTHVVGGLGLVNGDTLTGALATTASNTSDVGTYGITQGTLAASANYAVTYTGNNVTVGTRAITITADAKSMTYGDAAPTLTHVVGGLGLVNGDTLTGALATTASNISDVGTYGITQGTLAASANYAVTYTGNNVTVGTRAITITADAKSMTYGDAAPTLTHVVGGLGLVNGDTLTGALATTASNTSDVGTYGITQGTLAASANYAVTYTGNNVTVGKRAITVTADAQEINQGAALPVLTYNVTTGSLVDPTHLTGALSTTANAGSSAGIYDIIRGSLDVTANYDLVFVGNTLTIKAHVEPPASAPEPIEPAQEIFLPQLNVLQTLTVNVMEIPEISVESTSCSPSGGSSATTVDQNKDMSAAGQMALGGCIGGL